MSPPAEGVVPTVLQAPSRFPLADVLREVKFGRSGADQRFLDDVIAQLQRHLPATPRVTSWVEANRRIDGPGRYVYGAMLVNPGSLLPAPEAVDGVWADLRPKMIEEVMRVRRKA